MKIEDYAPTLKYRNGKYHFIVFELNLISSGSSAGEAYDTLRAKYDDLVRDLKAAGQEKTIPQPELASGAWYAPNDKPRQGEIAIFLIKMVILFGFLGAFAVAGTAQMKKSVAEMKTSLPQLGEIASSQVSSLRTLAARAEEATPERLEEIRQNIRTIVTRTAPLAAELQPLTSAFCPQPFPTDKAN